jgi:hypothetical protein
MPCVRMVENGVTTFGSMFFESHLHTKRILVYESDAALRELLREILEGEQYSINFAASLT